MKQYALVFEKFPDGTSIAGLAYELPGNGEMPRHGILNYYALPPMTRPAGYRGSLLGRIDTGAESALLMASGVEKLTRRVEI